MKKFAAMLSWTAIVLGSAISGAQVPVNPGPAPSASVPTTSTAAAPPPPGLAPTPPPVVAPTFPVTTPAYVPGYGYAPPYWAPPPAPAPAPAPRLVRHNTRMFVTGIVFTALGGVADLAGLFLLGDTVSCRQPRCDPWPERTTGIVFIAVGIAGLGVGGPFIYYGGQKAPPDPPTIGQRPTLVVGPRSAGIRFVF